MVSLFDLAPELKKPSLHSLYSLSDSFRQLPSVMINYHNNYKHLRTIIYKNELAHLGFFYLLGLFVALFRLPILHSFVVMVSSG